MSRYDRDIPPLEEEASRLIRECLKEDAARRKSFVPEGPLRILLGGRQYESFDPSKRRKVRLEVNDDSEWIEVRARTKEGDLLLASHLHCYDEVPEDGRKRKYATSLEGGQKINFIAYFGKDAAGKKVPVVDVSYQETKIFRVLSLLWKRLKNAVRELVRPIPGMPLPVLVVACFVVVSAPIAYMLFSQREESFKVADVNKPAVVVEGSRANNVRHRTSQAAQPRTTEAPGYDVEKASDKPLHTATVRAPLRRTRQERAETNRAYARLPHEVGWPADEAAMKPPVLELGKTLSAAPTPTPSPVYAEVFADEYPASAAAPYADQAAPAGAAPEPVITSSLEGEVIDRSADDFALSTGSLSSMRVRLKDATEVRDETSTWPGSERYAVTRLLPGSYVEVKAELDVAGNLIARTINISRPAAPASLNAADQAATDRTYSGAKVARDYLRTRSSSANVRSRLQLLKRTNTLVGGNRAVLDVPNALPRETGVATFSPGVAPAPDVAQRSDLSQATVVIPFKPDSTELSAEAAAQLEEVSRKVNSDRDYMIRVVGFAAQRVDPEATLDLIRRRTGAVVANLVEEHNVPARQIITPQAESRLHTRAPQRGGVESGDDRVEVSILQR